MGEKAAKIDWEAGLPSAADLTPLCQSLIPEDLAYAFKISPETQRTLLDVNRASHTTISSLSFQPSSDDSDPPEEGGGGSDVKKSRRTDDDSIENCEGKAVKKARLVWTPQLHKRFVEVVGHLGLKNAVPKTIMQLMNVEGLTRENVASHLQKYRLYVTRMQGLSDEGSSQSDQLFSSPPMQSSSENGKYNGSCGNMNSGGSGNNGVMGNMNSAGGFQGETGNGNSLHHHHHHYHHYHQQQYSNMVQQQKDWSGNKYNTTTYSHHLTHNNN